MNAASAHTGRRAKLAASFLTWLAAETVRQSWKTAFGRPLRSARDMDASTRRYKYAIRAPWPQPNPHAPEQLAPSVLHLPSAELKDFLRVTTGRLTRTLRTDWVKALQFAAEHKQTTPVTDDMLVRWLTESLFCRTMTPDLEERDLAVLGELAEGEGTLYKQDLFVASLLRTLAGLHVSGPTIYTRRRTPSARCEAVGIAFPQREDASLLIRPGDPAWEVAKHHAIVAACYAGLYGTHPVVHFPVDAINALSKTILPTDHVVFRLLSPHLYTQLCLNFSVMFIDKSPMHNDPKLPFTGFANAGAEGALPVMKAVYNGVPGRKTYPEYRWNTTPPRLHGDYGEFIAGYHRIIHRFVTSVLEGQDRSEDTLVRWWTSCGEHVRGFPSVGALSEPGQLEDVVAFIIWNAAIVHSVDHYSFGTLPHLNEWLRLRVPAPVSRDAPEPDRTTFTTADDRFRMFLTHRMHIRPNTARKLVDVDYGFERADHVQAQSAFIDALRAYDANPGVTRHAPLDDIATSIQY